MASYTTGVSDVGIESNVPALAWGPVIGGATAAAAITLILLLLGSGVGLTMVSPWSAESASFTTVSVTAAIWFVIVQWLSSALGGYLTGRLRTKWAGLHTDEVFFRDTAHGFLSWALATVVVAGLAGSAFTSLVGSGVQAASSVAATATVGATAAAAAGSDEAPDLATGYFTDLLLRPQDAAARAQSDDAAATAEVSPCTIADSSSLMLRMRSSCSPTSSETLVVSSVSRSTRSCTLDTSIMTTGGLAGDGATGSCDRQALGADSRAANQRRMQVTIQVNIGSSVTERVMRLSWPLGRSLQRRVDAAVKPGPIGRQRCG